MNQDQIESKSWELLRAYLSSAAPEKIHLFAARSSYNSNRRAFGWLADNPDLDRATALMIYWNLGAAWYVQYADEDQAQDAEVYRLLRLLEDRYQSGFYRDGSIWFDPHHSDGGRPDNYPDVPVLRPVAAVMLASVGTEYVDVEADPDGFDEGLPMEVVEAIHALHGDA